MPPPRERQSIEVRAERTVLAAVRLPQSSYDHADPFGELRELAAQAGARVVGELEQRRDRPEAGTYIGRGKLVELKGLCEATDATTIIFDHELSPKQIAAIERETERKVLDRSELILDIFASRATTHEARLQVELAQLEYTYPRLRAMWDHLERIVGSGGIGGVGTRGPGEQQLEIDRRLVQRRKSMLQRELDEIQARKRRAVQSRNQDHVTVGLVGYTNAGKSTLFNSLTEGGAYADDRVFATLMTRTRDWRLGTEGGSMGQRVMLSDTVGFVRDLPHHLVASFRATLEEATHADVLLLILDVSDPAAELHYETVSRTLEELFDDVRRLEERARKRDEDPGEPWEPPEVVLVLNKADRLTETRQEIAYWQTKRRGAIAVSSLPDPEQPGRIRMGHDELVERVREIAGGGHVDADITVPTSDSKAVHFIESRGDVSDRTYNGSAVTMRVRIGRRQIDELRARGGRVEIVDVSSGEPMEAHDIRSAGWRPPADDA